MSYGTLFVDFEIKGEHIIKCRQFDVPVDNQLWTIEFWGKKGGFKTTDVISADEPMGIDQFIEYCAQESLSFMERLQNDINQCRADLKSRGKDSDVYLMDNNPVSYGYRAYFKGIEGDLYVG